MAGLLCPACGKKVVEESDKLSCSYCGAVYIKKDGIISFTGDAGFYEGKFQTTHGEKKPRNFLQKLLYRCYEIFSVNYAQQRLRFIKRNLPDRGEMLDIGCGGGIEGVARPGRTVTGVDISLPSLRKAIGVYDRAVQADVVSLNFAGDSFDGVIASEILGHLEPAKRAKALEEIGRVLKKEGKVVITVETLGALRKKAEKIDRDLYRQYLVEQYGHFGLREPRRVLSEIEEAGFKVEKCKGVFSYWWPSLQVLEAFDNDYRKKDRRIDLWVRIVKIFSGRIWLRELFDLLCSVIYWPRELAAGENDPNELYLVLKKKR